jgi:hypothetical protein
LPRLVPDIKSAEAAQRPRARIPPGVLNIYALVRPLSSVRCRGPSRGSTRRYGLRRSRAAGSGGQPNLLARELAASAALLLCAWTFFYDPTDSRRFRSLARRRLDIAARKPYPQPKLTRITSTSGMSADIKTAPEDARTCWNPKRGHRHAPGAQDRRPVRNEDALLRDIGSTPCLATPSRSGINVTGRVKSINRCAREAAGGFTSALLYISVAVTWKKGGRQPLGFSS